MRSYDFLVKRNDLTVCSVEPASEPPIAAGEVLLRVERFGLTANNITYGVAGDLIGYWRFFPAPGDWGRIPVWGIGTVIASAVEAVAEGGRYFGYFPMSGHLVVSPAKAGPAGFADDAVHRRELPPVYNQYSLMTEALGFPAGQDNHQVIYRPLFTTAFVLADYFADNDDFGAGQVILASASSKTAFGTAFMMREFLSITALTDDGLMTESLEALEHDFANFEIIISLNGSYSDYIKRIPFHTSELNWPVPPGDDYTAQYRDLRERIDALVDLLAGSESED